MSIRIKKRNGRREKYKEAKLINSLQKAGVETRIARMIARSIEVRNGMYSREIKCRVFEALGKVDKELADRYWSTRGMKVEIEAFEANGHAIVSVETMTELGLRSGDSMDIFNGERFEKVRVYPLEGYGINPETVSISHHDMYDIGVHPGSRIAVRKHLGTV